MDPHQNAKAAIIDHLRALQATPDVPVDLYDIGVPLVAKGFDQEELYQALRDLEGDRLVELDGSTNRLVLRKPLM